MPSDAPSPNPTRPPTIRRVEAVVNAASGSVGPGAAEALEAIVAAHGAAVRVADAQPKEIEAAVRAAVAAKPDLLVVLAGDGTAKLAADLCGPQGPLIAALPGGTMNMLPHALYGRLAWREALEAALTRGVETSVSGGMIDGRSFYVAAIVGAPALWAPAREAIRAGRLKLAFLRARRALNRAFQGRLHYRLDSGAAERAEALTVICPLVSRALHTDDALEVAALNPRGTAEALRLGARTLLADLLGDWRQDPAVTVTTARAGKIASRSRIPAVLDGEPHRLNRISTLAFTPKAFRALALPDVDPHAATAPERGERAAAGAAAAAEAARP